MKSATTDQTWRTFFIQNSVQKLQVFSLAESLILKKIRSLFVQEGGGWELLDDDLFFKTKKLQDSLESLETGRCFGTVQAPPEEVLAWMYHTESNQSKAKHISENGTNQFKVSTVGGNENFQNHTKKSP